MAETRREDFFSMRDIVKDYPLGDDVSHVLKGIDLTAEYAVRFSELSK